MIKLSYANFKKISEKLALAKIHIDNPPKSVVIDEDEVYLVYCAEDYEKVLVNGEIEPLSTKSFRFTNREERSYYNGISIVFVFVDRGTDELE